MAIGFTIQGSIIRDGTGSTHQGRDWFLAPGTYGSAKVRAPRFGIFEFGAASWRKHSPGQGVDEETGRLHSLRHNILARRINPSSPNEAPLHEAYFRSRTRSHFSSGIGGKGNLHG